MSDEIESGLYRHCAVLPGTKRSAKTIFYETINTQRARQKKVSNKLNKWSKRPRNCGSGWSARTWISVCRATSTLSSCLRMRALSGLSVVYWFSSILEGRRFYARGDLHVSYCHASCTSKRSQGASLRPRSPKAIRSNSCR